MKASGRHAIEESKALSLPRLFTSLSLVAVLGTLTISSAKTSLKVNIATYII
jgi:hypothetical protein